MWGGEECFNLGGFDGGFGGGLSSEKGVWGYSYDMQVKNTDYRLPNSPASPLLSMLT